MIKILIKLLLSSFLLLISNSSQSVPLITGEPVIVQHLGRIDWPQDNRTTIPYLTQSGANDINDLHGELSCDLIISTPGNYHMALKDAMFGRADLSHIGLLEQQGTPAEYKVTICWSTSPPVSIDQIHTETLQFKNIKMVGRPALVMAPGSVMDMLVINGQADGATRQPFLTNQGNVIIMRGDKSGLIQSVCDLSGPTRVITPHPDLEVGSFSNFSGTLFNVANLNRMGCDATRLFHSIFSQDISKYDLSVFRYPYNIDGVLSVFGRGTRPQGTGAKWVASSRIMHRDIPYALCNDEADAAITFYHLALYMQKTLASAGCKLDILPLGGTITHPAPLPGNKVATLHIAKVTGIYSRKVNHARNVIYRFLTSSPVWEKILASHGLTR